MSPKYFNRTLFGIALAASLAACAAPEKSEPQANAALSTAALKPAAKPAVAAAPVVKQITVTDASFGCIRNLKSVSV